MLHKSLVAMMLLVSAPAFADIAPVDSDAPSDTDLAVTTQEEGGCSTVAGGGFVGAAIAGLALLSRRSRK